MTATSYKHMENNELTDISTTKIYLKLYNQPTRLDKTLSFSQFSEVHPIWVPPPKTTSTSFIHMGLYQIINTTKSNLSFAHENAP